ncbi:neutral/alkaline non-lysosomal ceramidase N-terminal domain-containing protein [Pyxidicoccus parkwayensis]|uniref:Neutral/alkaline non-lysosomal ceramidase N-terminal domain-containing protein n=1 Tax=Pyxidicoccus parkwayensis TaxID=2813578 RepID=A0ABX7NNY7_9BACT|nr:neutral/alkaline non-lysosomal ceramidase N-terminal domain-containing protein [Pyxidicoccus parkwaysis]QSQ20143.1 neutral/alkaline non-lysosomal ceramidase N-terminal domain-containing protein [Pyxidicoccus parkwaysis]
MAFLRRVPWRSLIPLVLLTVGAAYSLASWNWCGSWAERAPVVLSQARGEGPLRAGAAKVALVPPFPVVVAGYAPPRPEAAQADPPLHARAVVLEAGGARVGLVSLDLLSVTMDVVERVRAQAAASGLGEVLVMATHAHSSMGGYDSRLVAQLAGTGKFRQESVDAIVTAAVAALTRAAAAMTDVTLAVGEAHEPSLVYSRSSGTAPDGALTRVVLRAKTGPVAELLLFAAHPTMVARERAYVDPDYPGRLCALRESEGSGVTLLLQGAVGNASVAYSEGKGLERVAGFAQVLATVAGKVAVSPVGESVRLSLARVEATMPRPDASRLVPSLTRAAGDNLLCESAQRVAEVGALALGPLELVTVPGEPTVDAGAVLVGRTGATGVLGLANGYVGYVEAPELVNDGRGESRRQYFGPALLERLASAAELAARTAGFSR